METALGVAQHPQPVTLAILKGDDPFRGGGGRE
jgi:hypothetical protein